MRIIEPSVELAQELNPAEIMRHIERAGRVCYKSESNISDTSAEKFIANIIKSGHESVIEHFSCTFKIICDRGILAEITRHRLASFSVESSRYCVAGDTQLTLKNPHLKFTISELYDYIQKSHNGSWKRLLIKQLNENKGTLEFAKIKNIFKRGIKAVYKVSTDLGYVLKCTADHEIYTPNGYKKLNELKTGEKIYINGVEANTECLYKNEDWLYYQNITLNKTFVTIAEEFGYSVSALKKWARKFKIPKKGTGYFNIGREPWNKGMTEFEDSRVKKMVNSLRTYHCNGVHKGEKLILKTDTTEYQKYLGEKCEICGKCEELQVHHKDKNRTNNHPSNLITLCNSCHLRIHSQNLKILHADEIKSIEFVGNEEVYDIEMDSEFHNFIANGVVVHNCDYSGDKFGGELTFIKPCYWNDDDENYLLWRQTMETIEQNYLTMRKNGARPEQARAILPNSLKTEIFMTANLREWRHFLKLRTSKRAHPQMRQIALKIFEILNENLPIIFSDIEV